ncbi:MAG: hypothetical protein ACPGXK_13140 [Phycisphaerae bacterium]
MKTLPHGFALPQSAHYLNETLSILSYHHRLLAEILNLRHTLMQKIELLVRSSSAMDEFFRSVVSSLQRTAAREEQLAPIGRLTARQELRVVRQTLLPILTLRDACFRHVIRPGLAQSGTLIKSWFELSDDEKERALCHFDERIFPVLTPLSVDPGHPFRVRGTDTTAITARLSRPGNDAHCLALVPIHASVPSWFNVGIQGDTATWISSYSLVRQHLARFFPGMEITAATPVRMLRARPTETSVNNGENDHPVVIHYTKAQTKSCVQQLLATLAITRDDGYEVGERLRYDDLSQFIPLTTTNVGMLSSRVPKSPQTNVFDSTGCSTICESTHSDDGNGLSLPGLLVSAIRDPLVTTIKLAIRLEDISDALIALLHHRVTNGVHVELFISGATDDHHAAPLPKQLHTSGIRINSTAHADRIAPAGLFVRREKERVRCYAYMSTVRLSEIESTHGLAILSGDRAMNQTFADRINTASWFSENEEHIGHSIDHNALHHPVVVGHRAIMRLSEELIGHEAYAARAGLPSGVVGWLTKVNNEKIIETCYEASTAGVPMHLFVREACTLRPNVTSLSEHIHVYSCTGVPDSPTGLLWFRHHLDREHQPIEANDRETGGPSGVFLVGTGQWHNSSNDAGYFLQVSRGTTMRAFMKTAQEWYAKRSSAWRLRPDGTYSKAPSGPLSRAILDLERDR